MNRLVALHARSLASYLAYASPTWHRGDDRARQTLGEIADQQREASDRLGSWILRHDGVVSPGSYPMEFTGYHDLSFDFLLGKLIERQRADIAAIEACLASLDEAGARGLAEEVLGEAKAHLDSLDELKRDVVAR